MSGCCHEQGCRRKQPFKIRRSGLTGRVYLLSRYKEGVHPKGQKPGGPALIESIQRHDVTDEVKAFMTAEMTSRDRVLRRAFALACQDGWSDAAAAESHYLSIASEQIDAEEATS